MATATDLQVLTLAQWFSPAYPVGAFAYSHGLEWAIDTGEVADAADVQAWIGDALRHGAGWNDCLFLAAAYRAEDTDALAGTDTACRAFAASRERLQETVLQGEAFCTITATVWQQEITGLAYPVAAGRAARLEGLPLALTAQMYLQAFAANLAAAAMRLVPLGQSEGQSVIRALTPDCAEIAARALGASLDDLSATALLADVAAMKHETQYSRIFRT